MTGISQSYLRSILLYNEDDGIFYWLKRDRSFFESDKGFKIFNSKFSGKKAGNVHFSGSNNYITIRVLGKLYYAHRLAWLYKNGEWPSVIDHIDGNGLNNKIFNLRSVTNEINAKNQKIRRSNTSGRIGVYLNKEINKWIAQGHKNGKTFVILSSDDFGLACEARDKYETENKYHHNHGRHPVEIPLKIIQGIARCGK